MGGIKKAINKVTGRDAKKEAERQAREAERQAKMQAEVDAAQKAGLSNVANAGEADATSDVEAQKNSTSKKKIRGGRKGLTVSRAGGSGLNI